MGSQFYDFRKPPNAVLLIPQAAVFPLERCTKWKSKAHCAPLIISFRCLRFHSKLQASFYVCLFFKHIKSSFSFNFFSLPPPHRPYTHTHTHTLLQSHSSNSNCSKSEFHSFANSGLTTVKIRIKNFKAQSLIFGSATFFLPAHKNLPHYGQNVLPHIIKKP